jgi:hypothetical protein
VLIRAALMLSLSKAESSEHVTSHPNTDMRLLCVPKGLMLKMKLTVRTGVLSCDVQERRAHVLVRTGG